MKTLKNLLVKKFQGKNASQKMVLDDKTVFFVFKKVVQEEFGNLGVDNFKPDYFDGKKIFIKCYSSNWASELWVNKNKIVRKINKELGENVIEEIKVK
jgi:predicted nucleic acid-binding Zn ribbon protein